MPIWIPPLRQRREDIPLLADHFLKHFCQRHNRPEKTIAADAMQQLTSARWPGNVRQLRNVIERLVVTVTDEVIRAGDIPTDLDPMVTSSATAVPAATLADAVEQAEKSAILAALAACGNHRDQTAKTLGISIRTLHYKMNRHGLY